MAEKACLVGVDAVTKFAFTEFAGFQRLTEAELLERLVQQGLRERTP